MITDDKIQQQIDLLYELMYAGSIGVDYAMDEIYQLELLLDS